MEVILQQSVEKLGHPGDVVKVSNGYARNYLLPRGIAVVATEGNKKQIEAQRQRLAGRLRHSISAHEVVIHGSCRSCAPDKRA